jgi:hypothetical protein
MGKIKQILIKTKDRIKDLLIEMKPEMEKEIELAYKDNFNEWFGMLFQLDKFDLRPGLIDINNIKMSKSKLKEAQSEMLLYENLRDLHYISMVQIGQEYHLIDGYHRVIKARKANIDVLKATIWTKVEHNDHKNVPKIRGLIMDNI